jgi:hypothetical protein
MNESRTLKLEVLSGPLDGTLIALETDAEWSRAGDGETPLTFPWDTELGAPQARLTFDAEEGRWYLEGLDAPHGTYRVNREERLTGKKVQLKGGDIIKASQTWLLVRQA